MTFKADEYQQTVIDWRRGEAVVAASAGSGKSTVAVERTAALFNEGVDPSRTLSLMYNRDAAESFREKLAARVGATTAKRANVYTFHAWGFALLRAWYPRARMLSEVLGAPGSKINPAKVVYTAMDKAGVDFWEKDWKAWRSMADFVRDRDLDWTTEAEEEQLRKAAEKQWQFSYGQTNVLLAFLREYEAIKREGTYAGIDFADMTFLPCRALRIWEREGRPEGGHPVAELRDLYQHVTIDEAQDQNPSRWRITLHLAAHAQSLISVGDMRQSLYSFTGAEPDMMLRRLEAGATLLNLPVNRRSTARIVEEGNRVARGHDWHLGGDATSLPQNGQGPPIVVDEDLDERNAVVGRIRKALAAGVSPRAFAILSRTNRGLAPFELGLLVAEIPCRVLGRKGGVWGTDAGQDVLSYLRLMNGDLRGDIVSVMNSPLRYCTKKDVVVWIQTARTRGVGTGLERLMTPVAYDSGAGISRLVGDLRRSAVLDWPAQCRQTLSWLVEGFDFEAAKDTKSAKAAERKRVADGREADPTKPFEDVGESDEMDERSIYAMLYEAALSAGSLIGLEAQIRAASRATGDVVELSTVHKYKGNERAIVFVTGACKGMMPHMKSTDDEEERRIFYVAVTRAKTELIITTGGHDVSPFLEGFEEGREVS